MSASRSPRAGRPPAPVLPDVLQPGLALVFCGTAAGRVSAAAGAYYANRGNAFWRTLHTVGLTPRRLAPEEFRTLPAYGIGLTDLAKHHVGNDADLPGEAFDAAALRRRIRRVQPRWLAFTSKNAAQAYRGAPVAFGEQDWTLGSTRVFVLPSPSGQARRSWDLAPWRALAAEVARVRPLPSVRIRRARPADAVALLALENLFPGDRMSPAGMRRMLRAPSACLFVAEAGGDVVASLTLLTRLNSGIARIYSVAVAPQARGRGLAQRLIARAEAEARTRGKREVRLEVRVDNDAARGLYARLGYLPQAPLPRYYEDGADGIRLARVLRGPRRSPSASAVSGR